MRVEFFAEAKLILIWGSNSIASNLHFWRHAQAAKRAGARLVCIDPRKTETADKCDEHIALLPGTDARAGAGADARADRRTTGSTTTTSSATPLGWDAAARARAAMAARARGRGLRRARGADRARWRATTAPPSRPRSASTTACSACAAAAMRRAPIACLPALVGAWRDRAGGLLLSQLGPVPGGPRRAAAARPARPAARPRTINMSAIGDALLDTRRTRSRRWSSTTATRSRSRRIRARWSRASRAKTCSPSCSSSSRPTPPTTPTTCCRRPRSSSTGTSTPATATPTCCSTSRPIAPRGEARSNTWVFRELARRMGFDEPCFADDDETLCRSAFAPRARSTSTSCRRRASPRLKLPDAPFAEGGFPTPSGTLRVLQRPAGRDGPGRPARPRAQLRAGRQLAASFRWR